LGDERERKKEKEEIALTLPRFFSLFRVKFKEKKGRLKFRLGFPLLFSIYQKEAARGMEGGGEKEQKKKKSTSALPHPYHKRH